MKTVNEIKRPMAMKMDEMAAGAFHAMGTTVAIHAPQSVLWHALPLVQSLFIKWEETLSRFKPDSELSRLNDSSGTPVEVSPLLWTVLEAALAAAKATRGIFDPGLESQLRAIGYRADFETLDRHQPPAERRARPGGLWRSIDCRPERRTVTLPPGLRLDFGGIAKGMAVDAAVARLDARGLQPALIDAGGDLAVLGTPPGLGYWPVAVEGLDGETVGVIRGALATSGPSRRNWLQGDRRRHHLLDPVTGQPAEHALLSVSVLAPTCAQADVAAKTAWILGREKGPAFLLAQGLSGLFRGADARLIRIGDWPARAQGRDA